MSMTQEEAIINLEKLIALYYTASEQNKMVDYSKIIETLEFAAVSLRTPTRERVEKAWRGEWMAFDECSNEGVYCKRCKKKVYRIEYANEKMRSPFCPACGAAQTDEAVEIVMERLEELNEDNGCS